MRKRKKLYNPGVYLIRNTRSGRVYVGCAQSIESRWVTHRTQLSYGEHHSKALQRDWNPFDPELFEFVIVQQSNDLDSNRALERRLILQYKERDLLYNTLAAPRKLIRRKPNHDLYGDLD